MYHDDLQGLESASQEHLKAQKPSFLSYPPLRRSSNSLFCENRVTKMQRKRNQNFLPDAQCAPKTRNRHSGANTDQPEEQNNHVYHIFTSQCPKPNPEEYDLRNIARVVCKEQAHLNAKKSRPLQLSPPARSLDEMTRPMRWRNGEQFHIMPGSE